MKKTMSVALVCILFSCGDNTTESAPKATKAEIAAEVNAGKSDFSIDPCRFNGWYDDGQCDWFCPMPDGDCDLPPLFEVSQGATTKYPILLAHGFNASPTFFSFTGVEEKLRADGHVVFSSAVPPYQSSEIRAKFLATQVDELLQTTGSDKINIIAHSMGGLDSRVLISKEGYGSKVATLTTISTPHRGSRAADVALKLIEGKSDDALDALAAFLGNKFSDVATNPDLRAALEGISESHAVKFNQSYLDDEAVYYQSWAGVSNVLGIQNPLDDKACENKFIRHEGTVDKMSALLTGAAHFVSHGEFIPNDGMVTVESSKWGDFQGCIPADHADEVGAFRPAGEDPDTGFDHIKFYQFLAFDLAERGF